MGEGSKKVSGGKMVRVRVNDEVEILGDFFMYPEQGIDELEVFLEQVDCDGVEKLSLKLEDYMRDRGIDLLGVSAMDIAEVYLEAVD